MNALDVLNGPGAGMQVAESRDRQLLRRAIGNFDPHTREEIKQGKVVVLDYVAYAAVLLLPGGGRQPIMDNTKDTYVLGRSSFRENRLPKGQNMVVTRLQLGWGKDDDTVANVENDPEHILYTNNAANVPADLLNGDIIIVVDGGTKLHMPIWRFFQPGAVYSSAPGFVDTIPLDTPFLIQENKEVEIYYELPKGATLSVAASEQVNDFLRVAMFGPLTTTTAKPR